MESLSVQKIIEYAKGGNLDNPQIISEYIVRLSAYTWWAGQDILTKEVAYAEKWKNIRSYHSSDKQAEQAMKTEKEWRELEEAKLAQRTIIQTIQAMKHRLRTMTEEYFNS